MLQYSRFGYTQACEDGGQDMRKKSHISLARFLVRVAGDDVLRRRWKAFYVGSLLPDCRPSFLTVRHEYEETFDLVERKDPQSDGGCGAQAGGFHEVYDRSGADFPLYRRLFYLSA